VRDVKDEAYQVVYGTRADRIQDIDSQVDQKHEDYERNHIGGCARQVCQVHRLMRLDVQEMKLREVPSHTRFK
jgi:hypothetical protein